MSILQCYIKSLFPVIQDFFLCDNVKKKNVFSEVINFSFLQPKIKPKHSTKKKKTKKQKQKKSIIIIIYAAQISDVVGFTEIKKLSGAFLRASQ